MINSSFHSTAIVFTVNYDTTRIVIISADAVVNKGDLVYLHGFFFTAAAYDNK